MLESLAATLLNRVLGSYIENFDPTQLNLGIWSGDVKLKNLELKKDCLDPLDLPVDVQRGILGELSMNVPWSSLKNKPVKITIEDCFMIVTPNDKFYKGEGLDERQLKLKLKRLVEWEIQNQSKKVGLNNIDDNKNDPASESFIQSLITKVIDNLQVVIRNIHVRFEDIESKLCNFPSSIGLQLKELSAISTDAEWQPSFIDLSTNLTHKLLTLSELSIYWNTDDITSFLPPTNGPINWDTFIETIRNDMESHQGEKEYILKPVNTTGKLIVNKAGTTAELPHINVELVCEEFGINLNDCQYLDVLTMVSSIHIQRQSAKFKVNRPLDTVQNAPEKWFKYYGKCILSEVHEKNNKWTWKQIKLRCEQRRRYITLWKQKLALPTIDQPLPSVQDEEELERLHRDLTFDMITLFRMMAKTEHAKEKIASKEQSQEPNKVVSETEEPEKNAGWLSSWWNADKSADNTVMTEEQKQELYAIIEFNEAEIKSTSSIEFKNNVPKHWTEWILTGSLKNGSVLIENKNVESGSIGGIKFNDCRLGFSKRPDSFLFNFKLDEFKVEDGSSNCLFKNIISPKLAINADLNVTEPLVDFSFEKNPLDDDVDSRVGLKLLGTTIYYNVYFLTSVLRFFQPKKQHADTIGAIINATEATVEGWSSQTRMGIESLLEEHKTLDLNLDLQAPLIILPTDPKDWDSPCTIIDTGHISVISEVIPKKKIEELRNFSVEEYEKIKDDEINRLMFDRFKIISQDTQFLVGPTIQSTLSSLSESLVVNDFCILNKMKLEVTLDLSILPKAYKLPKIKISAHLPRLDVSYNDYQYKIIMNLLQNLIPQTNITLSEDMIASYHNSIDDNLAELEQKRLSDTVDIISKMTSLQIEQTQFQVSFNIDIIQFSMLKCVDSETMKCQKLVNLVGDNVKFELVKRVKEMEVSIGVHGLNLEDYIEKTDIKEFKYLISSNANIDSHEKNLFNMKYYRTQRIVKHEDTFIEVFDQDLDINLMKLILTLTPRSILTLLNYATTTFTNPQEEMPADILKHNSEDKEDSPGKLNMNVNIEGLLIYLNENNEKLATLDIASGKFTMFLLPTSMKLNTKFDGVDLIDGLSELDSPRKSNIISMNGKQLFELSYETYDSETNTNNFDSLLECQTGAMFIDFKSHSINRILTFLYKFQKMKSYFDSLSRAAYDQAPSIETVKNMKVNATLKSPIIQFYCNVDHPSSPPSIIKCYLGEFFVNNTFTVSNSNGIVNKIKAGLRSGQISSILDIEKDLQQKLYLAEDMNVTFDINHNINARPDERDFEILGNLGELSLNVTEVQLDCLHEILEIIQRTLTLPDIDEKDVSPSPDGWVSNNSHSLSGTDFNENNDMESPAITEENIGKSISMQWEGPSVSLTLYDDTKHILDVDGHSITKLTLHGMNLSYLTNRDFSSNGEAHISSFSIEDTRNVKDNKFKELVPKVDKEENQLSATLTRKMHQAGLLTNLSIVVNSPRFILAMDHLMAIKKFFDILTVPKTSLQSEEAIRDVVLSTDKEEENEAKSTNLFQYSLNIIDAAILLLLDPSDLNTEAIVFSVGQILFTEQNISTLTTNNIGIFLTKMNTTEEQKIRLLDDFSSSITIDRRNSSKDNLSSQIQASVEPVRMRISLRDIRLAMLIFDRAVSLLNAYSKKLTPFSEREEEKPVLFSKEFEKRLTRYIPSHKTNESDTESSVSSLVETVTAQLRDEKFTADFGGFRVILLGDIHEMPILDARINPFVINAKNWSSEFDGLATLTSCVNIFNYSRSSWEPLIEETDVTFHLSKNLEANSDSALLVDIITREMTEVTLSSRSVATLSNIPASLSGEIKLKPRGYKKPYILINDTGLELEVWIQGNDSQEKDKLTTLGIGEKLPWEFEDWQSIREQLDTNNQKNILHASVKGDKYDTIMIVDATNEGEELHVLKPAQNGVHRRIVCDLKCNEETVKEITFRSTLLLENITCTKLGLMVESNSVKDPFFFSIDKGESKSIPLEYVYDCKLYLKPEDNPEYGWSSTPILWEDILKTPTSIECIQNDNANSKFYFELKAQYDNREPLAKIFPHMKIVISPSLVIENLLPYDMNYSIFSKREDMRTERFLKKGESVSIHSVSLEEFLLLSVQPCVDGSPKSKPSIVNTPSRTAIKPEDILPINFENGQRLNLKVKYQNVDGSRSKHLKIYSPYIIMNGSSKDLFVEGENFNVAHSKVILEDRKPYSNPLMFSFMDNEQNNRARIKFLKTENSIPLSFDAIGQEFDVTLKIPNQSQECNLGVNIVDGVGAYHLSKIVNIHPRYMIKNNLDFPINVCELGSPEGINIEPNESFPLYNLQNIINKQLMIKTLGNDSEYTAPFFVKDVGITYVRLLKEQGNHMLLKLEILLQDATLFVNIKSGKNLWPYSIRNFSDYEYIFYQRDFKIVDEHYDETLEADTYESPEIEYKPIYYRVPPRSVMPYAWDYPTAKQKKLVLTARGRTREIQLAEIGNLKPMRIPGDAPHSKPIIIDFSVVADGPTQALIITNYDPKLSLYKLRERRSNSTDMLSQSSTSVLTTNDVFETKEEEEEKLFTKVIVSIKGLGISLINTHLQELMYINVGGIELRYNDSELYRTISWKLKWLQIDNQLFGSTYQNVLFPANIPKDSKEIENHPVFSGSVSKVKDDSFGIPYFKHVTFLLQEFAIQLDEDFIYALIDFIKFPGASWNNVIQENETLEEKISLPTLKEVSFSNDMYFELFHIQPTLLHISFVRSERLQQNGDESIELPDITTTLSSMYFLNILTMAMGNVNDAPIKLNSLMLDNLRVPMSVLYGNIKTHYGQQFIYQIHMIVGSADFLGNPVGLFNTISSGVWDLFYEPYQGYMLNDRPQEIGLHIAKGGLSFAQKTVFGISDSMTKFTGSMAKGLSVTQDREFQESRRLQKRIVNNNGNVLGDSATSFISTIGSGLAGLALDPLKGGQREGAAGFFKGVGKGIVGLPTKTAIGILDLTSNLSQGVRQSTTALAGGVVASRVRLPRYIDSQEQVIYGYCLRESQGQYWLKTCNGGIFINDHYLAHVLLPGRELAVVVSMERICEIKISTQECMWGTSYNTIQGIAVEAGGIRIKLKSQSEYFIPVEQPQEKKYIYRHIKVAVLEFNRYCEATL